MPDVQIQYSKSASMYQLFFRKENDQKTTHYCPGCGHGTAQKLIASVIDELAIQDRTVFLSPVGCSVFSYYYFDTGNIQCSHGRAPAVATGIRRTLSDAIIIAYQGDGDLAGIGMTEIVHAANRGENITVFFINNAIYGMTGGQMAPTTPIGVKTLTTPEGRSKSRDGNPIGMCELLASLQAPAYIERCSLSTPKQVLRTRLAIKKALDYQVRKKGFSFVEILSPCPTNWRMSPLDARAWIAGELEGDIFPLKCFRDVPQEIQPDSLSVIRPDIVTLLTKDSILKTSYDGPPRAPKYIKIAGFGGQGVLSAGELVAFSALEEGFNVSWLPSYGPEMRGGSANASVICSDEPIGSPVVDCPNVLIAMNNPSLELFENSVTNNGIIVLNSSLVERKPRRTDVKTYAIPATDIAKKAGLVSAANVVMITALAAITGFLHVSTVKHSIGNVLRKKLYTDKNLEIVENTLSYLREKEMM
ncbi:MAG: 2-oxoacid:acceptor oxidoreductase family protein [Sphaerochaetaceae bacterium]|nr:2-oxoacid:acceptor oxidoreductase family protein [Sphaerochaetaceae bacterium]MDD4840671.1 2-oxoacid:acceptor oxidoreductase family protein [Sphaerochaetaceae bacterium]MDX9934477.1 2-oxoacid:acceptor oxidoreductase family protein [Sphaerochaetaceae bacterium]NLO59949.1 2-ketoisovalerate ferredoxin oxidoreductase [Spirochaetales bacterium]